MANETNAAAEQQSEDMARLFGLFANNLLPFDKWERLADWMWTADAGSTRLVTEVLDEPPKSLEINAPRALSTMLWALRKAMTEKSSLSAEERERSLSYALRIAVCWCLDEKTPRQLRLSAALGMLRELPYQEEWRDRRDSLRWYAEIAMRLLTDFEAEFSEQDRHDLAERAREALFLIAATPSEPKDFFLLLRHFCNLTMRLEVPSHESAKRDEWARQLGLMIRQFQITPTATTSEAGVEGFAVGCAFVRDMAYQALMQNGEFLRLETGRVLDPAGVLDRLGVSGPLVGFGLDSEWETFLTLMTIARGHVANGRSVDAGFIDALVRWRRRDWEAAKLFRSKPMQHLDEEQVDEELDAHKYEGIADRTERLIAQLMTHAVTVPEEAGVLAQSIEEALTVKPRRRGLALSGGGFRSSLFHIGVLACLADRDELRRLDDLSCVSGGSIVGAAYSVRLQALLASKHDLQITVEDYRRVVADLVDVFKSVTSMNLRARAFAHPGFVLRMWLGPDYTFTERIADLLDDHLFAPLISSHPAFRGKDSKGRASKAGRADPSSPIRPAILHEAYGLIGWPISPWDLRAPPLLEPFDFQLDSPRNRMRRAPIPELFINTTSLNTGNQYLFSTDCHGEVLNSVKQEISIVPTSPWRRYEDPLAGILPRSATYRLARLVAASAAVPGLLPPVLFPRTAKQKLLALADGGVCDNQGFNMLLRRGCDWVLASDAAGQLRLQDDPDVANFEVVGRATDILMEQMRERSYRTAEVEQGTKRDLKFTKLHLTLDVTDPPRAGMFEVDDSVDRIRHRQRGPAVQTLFDVNEGLQRLLSRVRTDLDCFCESEALSLMADGYLQALNELGGVPTGATADNGAPWEFMAIADDMKRFDKHNRLARVLQAGQHRFMRLPRIFAAWLAQWRWGRLTLACAQLAGVVGGLLGATLLLWQSSNLLAGHPHVIAAGMSFMAAGVGIHVLPQSSLKRWLWKLASGPFLLLAMLHAWATILFSDPVFKWVGRHPRPRVTVGPGTSTGPALATAPPTGATSSSLPPRQ